MPYLTVQEIRQDAIDQGWSKETYLRRIKDYEARGWIAPIKDGAIEETWEGVKYGTVSALKGLGSTLDEAGFGDGLYNEMTDVMDRNQDILPDPTYKTTSFDLAHLGRTIGTGVAQSGTALAAGVATTALTGGNAVAGGAVTTGIVFAQTYGDEVKEFRQLMPDQDESTVKGLAFISSLGQGLIESVAGPEAIASGVAKRIVSGAVKQTIKQYGKKRVMQVLATVGKNAVKGGIGEGAEEVMQGMFSNIAKRMGGADVPVMTLDEAVEQFAGGAWPGAIMSGAAGVVEVKNQKTDDSQKKNSEVPTSETDSSGNEGEKYSEERKASFKKHWKKSDELPVGELAESVRNLTDDNTIDDSSFVLVKPKSRLTKAMSAITKELTGQEPVYFIPDAPNAGAANGFTGKGNRLFINVDTMAQNPAKTTGHEFTHYLESTDAKAYKEFQQVVFGNLKENHKEYLDEIVKDYENFGKELSKEQVLKEFTGDVMGDMFVDDTFWKEVFSSNQDPSRLQKIAKAIIRFVDTVKAKLKGIKDASEYLFNLEKVRSEAVRITQKTLSGEQYRFNEAVSKVNDLKTDTPKVEISIADQESKPVAESEKLVGEEGYKTWYDTEDEAIADMESMKKNGLNPNMVAPAYNDKVLKYKIYRGQAEIDKLNTEYQAKVKAEQDAKDKKLAEEKAERKNIDGFADDATPLQRGNAVKALNKQVRLGGEVMTVKEAVRKLIKDGKKPNIEQESKVKPMSRQQYFRATQEQQDAHEKRMREAETKNIYRIGGYNLGKTAYKYAEYLIEKQKPVKPAHKGMTADELRKSQAQKQSKPEPTLEPEITKPEAEPSDIDYHHVKTVKLTEPTGKSEEIKLKKAKKALLDTVTRLTKIAPEQPVVHNSEKIKEILRKNSDLSQNGLHKTRQKVLALHDTIRIEYPNGKGYTIVNNRKALQKFAKRIRTMSVSLSSKITVPASNARKNLAKIKTGETTDKPNIIKVAKSFLSPNSTMKRYHYVLEDVKNKRIMASDGVTVFVAKQPAGIEWDLKTTEIAGADAILSYVENTQDIKKQKLFEKVDIAEILNELELVKSMSNRDELASVKMFADKNGKLAFNANLEAGNYIHGTIPDGAKSLGRLGVPYAIKIFKALKDTGSNQATIFKFIPPHDPTAFVYKIVGNKNKHIEALIMGARNAKTQAYDNEDIDFSLNRNYRKRQVNPFTTPEIKQAHDDILDNYNPEKHSDLALDMEAEALIAKHGVEPLVKEFVSGKRTNNTDRNVRLAKLLGNSKEFAKMKWSGSQLVIPFLKKYAEHGTEIARALRARHMVQTGDAHVDTEASMIQFFNAFTKRYKRYNDKTKAIQKELEIQNKIQKELQKIGVDLFNLTKKQTSDRKLMAKALRIMQARKATIGDKLYEFWVSSILSGLKTHARNFTGNTGMISIELGPQRLVEAIVNSAIKNPKGATFSEFKDMWKAIGKSMKQASANFAESWDTELPTTDDLTKVEDMHGVAIAGTKGRIIRMPLRFLLAADEFAKTISGQVEASAMAHREAKQKGLKGEAMANYIENAVANKESDASKWGKRRAEYLAFQEKPQDGGLDEVVKGAQWLKKRDSMMGIITKFVFPFTGTPWNIVKSGIRKTPLGTFNPFGWHELATGKMKFGDEKFIHRVSEQALAWTTAMFVYAWMNGDDDDDLPVITGSKGNYGTNQYKWKQQNLPSMSVRIGDQWYSYSGIEPFAGMMANVVDSINAFFMAKDGQDGIKIAKHIVNSFEKNFRDKSFMQGLDDLIKLSKGDIRSVANFNSGWIPNLVRSTLTSADDKIRDRYSYGTAGEKMRDLFFVKPLEKAGLIKGIPQVDLWGDDIDNRNTGALVPPLIWKIVSPSLTQPTSMSKRDALIWNWNKNNPNDEYWPGLPSTSQKVAGKTIYMKGNDYYEFAKRSGTLTKMMLDRAIETGRINYQAPTEKDIRLLKKIIRKARARTKREFMRK